MDKKDDKLALVYTPSDMANNDKDEMVKKLSNQLESWARDMTIDQ